MKRFPFDVEEKNYANRTDMGNHHKIEFVVVVVVDVHLFNYPISRVCLSGAFFFFSGGKLVNSSDYSRLTVKKKFGDDWWQFDVANGMGNEDVSECETENNSAKSPAWFIGFQWHQDGCVRRESVKLKPLAVGKRAKVLEKLPLHVEIASVIYDTRTKWHIKIEFRNVNLPSLSPQCQWSRA